MAVPIINSPTLKLISLTPVNDLPIKLLEKNNKLKTFKGKKRFKSSEFSKHWIKKFYKALILYYL